jgi:uncharacterized protein (UPF0548 family)
VAVGDFNGDGKLDLAVANGDGDTVSIRLGNGTGTFTNAPDVVVGGSPTSVAVGGFNGDGKLDLAVANGDGSTVSIRLGTGDGTFTNAPDVVVGSLPFSVAVGDFNGDGKPDLATANSGNGSNSVSIRLGNGDGTFTNAPDVPVGITPASVAVGDFNGDGKPDLAVANEDSNTVTVLLNTFPGPPPPPPSVAPPQVVAVAFRRKGVARVRVQDAATGAVRGVLTPFHGFAGRLRLLLLDVNGDGSADLIVRALVHGKRKKRVYDAVTLAPLPPGLA